MEVKKKSFDEKDLLILRTLIKFGPKVSAERLSKNLKIPARTVSYRLDRLRKLKLLHPQNIAINSHKMGLGTIILVMEGNESYLADIFEQIPFIYQYASTIGKYNGYLAHGIFALAGINPSVEFLQHAKEKNLVSDFCTFQIIDGYHKKINLDFFDPEGGWTWNCEEWRAKIAANLQNQKKLRHRLETNPPIMPFDAKDVRIIDWLTHEPEITFKDLGKHVSLSKSQVSKRIQRLEKVGIIRGYRAVFTPFKNTLELSCFIKLRGFESPILNCFYDLPFSGRIFMESLRSYCIQLDIPTNNLNDFFQGFDLLRPYLDSYFFQISYSTTRKKALVRKKYSLYNPKTENWEIPSVDSLAIIENFTNNGAHPIE